MDALKQSFFIPAPKLTEENLPDQAGRVFIITGGYTGCGLELAKMLHAKNGTTYLAGRDTTKGEKAITTIQQHAPSSKGRVEFIKLDLADLSSIKPAIETFLSKESRLDVLTLNAGVMDPPAGSKTKQGYELQLGTNCIGSFLIFKLLQPVLTKTAASSPAGSVRVTWAGSSVIDGTSPKGGVTFDAQGVPETDGVRSWTLYGQSKVGNLFFAKEVARRFPLCPGAAGLISNAWNPGNLRTELTRHQEGFAKMLMHSILHPAIYGAYTELWAGWSEEAGRAENNGAYIWPWGRFGGYRKDVEAAIQEGKAGQFWDWCEGEVRQYL